MSSRALQRGNRSVDARHSKSHTRKRFSEYAAPAADIERACAVRIDLELPHDALEVRESPRIDRGLEKIQKGVVVPPRVAEAVIQPVVDLARRPPPRLSFFE